MSLILAAATVISVAIGVVCLIAGVVYFFRGRMLPGAVLLVVGFLLGGLSILGVFN